MSPFSASGTTHCVGSSASSLHFQTIGFRSRILAALEREPGVRLIARTTRGIAETDGGRLFYRRCQKILADIEDANSAVQAHSQVPVGKLRVTRP